MDLHYSIGEALGTDYFGLREPFTVQQESYLVRTREFVEDLGTREVDHPCHVGGLGRQQHMPGAEHVDRHDALRAAGRVVRKRPTDVAAMSGDENAHAAMILLVPGGRPPVCLAVRLGR